MNKNLEKAKQLEAEAKELRRAEKKFWGGGVGQTRRNFGIFNKEKCRTKI